jgi:hypothetical protein
VTRRVLARALIVVTVALLLGVFVTDRGTVLHLVLGLSAIAACTAAVVANPLKETTDDD